MAAWSEEGMNVSNISSLLDDTFQKPPAERTYTPAEIADQEPAALGSKPAEDETYSAPLHFFFQIKTQRRQSHADEKIATNTEHPCLYRKKD